MGEVKCEICNEAFATAQGLAGHRQFKHSEEEAPVEKDSEKLPALPTKPLPIEAIIADLKLPSEVSDGAQRIFDAGVAYGIKTVLVGIRAAQELSALGVQQASPLIKMAQEMRAAEGKAAHEAAKEAAHEAAMGVAGYFEERKPWLAASPNPMMAMFADVMRPALENVMRGFMPGQGQGQPAPAGFTWRKAEPGEEE